MTIDEIKEDKKYWQRLLRLAGYYKGGIDGIRGPLQCAAEQKWKAEALAFKEQYGEFDERTEKNIATLIPEAQKVIRKVVALGKKACSDWEDGHVGHKAEVKVIQGTRSYAEQNALYAKRPKVTNARGGYSLHNFGIAADLGVFVDGKYPDDHELYLIIGKLSRGIEGLEWGGDWRSFKDYPHYQLSKYGSTSSAIRAVF